MNHFPEHSNSIESLVDLKVVLLKGVDFMIYEDESQLGSDGRFAEIQKQNKGRDSK